MAGAEEAVASLRSSLICSICLDMFSNPLTLECGHSFCSTCIHLHWDKQPHAIKCPECRLTFPQQPEPQKNVILCKVVEELRGLQQKKRCLAAPDRDRSDSEAARPVCQKHSRELTFYCRTERRCLCYKCIPDTCRDHDFVEIGEESKRQKSKLLKDLQVNGHAKDHTKKEIEEWDTTIHKIKGFSDTTVDRVMTAFDKVRKTLDECQTLVTESVRFEEKSAMTEASKHLHNLQKHLEALNKYDMEAEQLLDTSDAIFLESLPHLAAIGCVPVSPAIQLCGNVQIDAVTKVLPEVTRLLQEDLPSALHPVVDLAETKGTPRQSSGFKTNHERCPPETSSQFFKPLTETDGCSTNMSSIRAQLHKVYENLIFDPETANKYIEISHENRKARHKQYSHGNLVPDSPRRFLSWQVMCTEGFSEGSHYWEVKVSSFFVQIGVAYGSLKRANERENFIGMNSQSWCLELRNMHQCVWHDNKCTKLRKLQYKRIGVHLDFLDGNLTFYGVTDKGDLERLHVFSCFFSERVCPVFWIGEDTSVELCHVNNRPLGDV